MAEKMFHNVGPAVRVRLLAMFRILAHPVATEAARFVSIANASVGAPLAIGRLEKRLEVDVNHDRDGHFPLRVHELDATSRLRKNDGLGLVNLAILEVGVQNALGRKWVETIIANPLFTIVFRSPTDQSGHVFYEGIVLLSVLLK